MTEAEWLACTDPERMFWFVRPRFTVQKALAFASSCDRLISDLPSAATDRAIPVVAEYVVGTGPIAQQWEPTYLTQSLLREALRVVRSVCRSPTEQRCAERVRAFCGVLRDLFSPCQPVTLDHRCRTRTTVGVAYRIHEEQAFDCLPVLADALEDAGCADEALLSHLRGPGPHVRGCWAVDLVLRRT